MIVTHLQDFYKGHSEVLDDAVIIRDNQLQITSNTSLFHFEEFTHKHLEKMSVATFNQMVKDLKELDENLDLKTINMSLINHGEHLRKK